MFATTCIVPPYELVDEGGKICYTGFERRQNDVQHFS
jgi:predicted DNA-binding transcriptional regulator YafY